MCPATRRPQPNFTNVFGYRKEARFARLPLVMNRHISRLYAATSRARRARTPVFWEGEAHGEPYPRMRVHVARSKLDNVADTFTKEPSSVVHCGFLAVLHTEEAENGTLPNFTTVLGVSETALPCPTPSTPYFSIYILLTF